MYHIGITKTSLSFFMLFFQLMKTWQIPPYLFPFFQLTWAIRVDFIQPTWVIRVYFVQPTWMVFRNDIDDSTWRIFTIYFDSTWRIFIDFDESTEDYQNKYWGFQVEDFHNRFWLFHVRDFQLEFNFSGWKISVLLGYDSFHVDRKDNEIGGLIRALFIVKLWKVMNWFSF